MLGVVYVNLLKDCLVELSPDDCGGFEVGGVPVGGEVEGLCEVGIGLVEIDVDGLEADLCSFELSGDCSDSAIARRSNSSSRPVNCVMVHPIRVEGRVRVKRWTAPVCPGSCTVATSVRARGHRR